MLFLMMVTLPWTILSIAQASFVLRRRSSPSLLKAGGSTKWSLSSMAAKPRRLEENVPGVVYVNDQCINCAACSAFAPETFTRGKTPYHVVYRQPETESEIQHARQALLACPVAAIRLETQQAASSTTTLAINGGDDHHDRSAASILVKKMTGKYKHQEEEDGDQQDQGPLFPRLFLDSVPNVYWVGHHNRDSFGAIPYLVKSKSAKGWIMVDTPKFSPSAVQAVTSLTGPQGPKFLLLTHVDDTADHGKWAQHFEGQLKRIFHAGDLGPHNWLGDKSLEHVEVLLPSYPVPSTSAGTTDEKLTVYSLDGKRLTDEEIEQWKVSADEDAIIVHTPGHSPGSICLYVKESSSPGGNNILFTGDTYAYTTRTNTMSGFPRYGNNRLQQADILQRLLESELLHDWNIIAPGHGHARDYRKTEQESDHAITDENRKKQEMQAAIQELKQWSRR